MFHTDRYGVKSLNLQPSKLLKINDLLKNIIILPIRLYQVTLSPLLGRNKCRFQPTCSHYMVQAIQEWGVLRGLWLGSKRIVRCHPWGKHGWDPVPKKEAKPDVDFSKKKDKKHGA